MTEPTSRLDPFSILLIVGGGISAYKAPDLVRRIVKAGGRVRVILTKAGREFVSPLALAAVSGAKVHEELFSLTDEVEMGHIELSRAADLVAVAPATADLMAKAANGLANDLASTALLATDKPVLMAPAMNVRMWLHPATRRNAERLLADGTAFVGPDEGEMACGEFGPGRMAEPEAIVAAIAARLSCRRALAGRHVLVTSGPTHEPIDPVRYLANRSSGKQGHAIAAAAASEGARVTLISGPVNLPDPPGVTVIRVETAREMAEAVEAALPADLGIFAAAVADWRVEPAPGKLKKSAGAPPALALSENPDILAGVARGPKRPKLLVGFAAETDDVIAHAKAKLAKKGCDLIVANDVSPATGVMGGDRNTVHLVDSSGVTSWPEAGKDEVARWLVAECARRLGEPT